MAYEEKAGEQEIHSGDGADSNSEALEEKGEALVKTSKPSASWKKTRDAKLQVPTLKITSPSPSNQSKGASDFDVKPCIKEEPGSLPVPQKKSRIKLTVKENPIAKQSPLSSADTSEAKKPERVKAGKSAAKVPVKAGKSAAKVTSKKPNKKA
ncbi:hypothetical protein PCANC_26201 [Puccinia coronata f. sp. avenae]|uniref:Uncharacterized protein n=1 Tax=Puccinia coronata f. sp. avenae TaxID=200324 RepID=A0A2N5U6E0_9BASI|nr:hypothetical protein PCANC_26201 [Puccinia coronata f. sp. avenae]